jgi:hypothetical protein
VRAGSTDRQGIITRLNQNHERSCEVRVRRVVALEVLAVLALALASACS